MIEGLIRRMMETRILKDKDYGGDTLYPEKVRIKTRIVEDTSIFGMTQIKWVPVPFEHSVNGA